MKRVLSALLMTLLFILASCGSSNTTSNSQSSVTSENSDQVSETSSDAEPTDILSKDDVLLMTVEIDGKKRYICTNEKLKDDESIYQVKTQECNFAILTDVKQSVKPTMVKKGDTFMNWKIAEVSANYKCLDDGRMYPTSNISIKLEGDITIKAEFFRDFYEITENLSVYPKNEYYNLFPYPVYSYGFDSLSFLEGPDFMFGFQVKNDSEMVEKYNLKYSGKYVGDIRITELYIEYFQPGSGHYNLATAESIQFSNEKLKTDSSKGEAYNTAITAYNDFLNVKTCAVADNKNVIINNFGNSYGDPSIINYSLQDVNGDGIPELHARSLYYYVFSYQNNQVVLWHKDTLNFWDEENHSPEDGGNLMDGSAAVKENSAIFSYKEDSNGTTYSYTTFDAQGKANTLNLTKSTSSNVYTIDNKKVTKEVFESKLKEFTALKDAKMEWKNYTPGAGVGYLNGKYFLEGENSGYEFVGNKVRSITDGKVVEENNYYTIYGDELHITFVGDGILVEGLTFKLSKDLNAFTGSDYLGSYTFIKQK